MLVRVLLLQAELCLELEPICLEHLVLRCAAFNKLPWLDVRPCVPLAKEACLWTRLTIQLLNINRTERKQPFQDGVLPARASLSCSRVGTGQQRGANTRGHLEHSGELWVLPFSPVRVACGSAPEPPHSPKARNEKELGWGWSGTPHRARESQPLNYEFGNT